MLYNAGMILSQLSVGDNFEFISLEKRYRKLYVKYLNEGSVTIGGEKKGEGKEDTWHNLSDGYTVSTACNVKKLKGKTAVKAVRIRSVIT